MNNNAQDTNHSPLLGKTAAFLITKDAMKDFERKCQEEFDAVKDTYTGIDKKTLGNADLARAFVYSMVASNCMHGWFRDVSMTYMEREIEAVMRQFEGGCVHQNILCNNAVNLLEVCKWNQDEVLEYVRRCQKEPKRILLPLPGVYGEREKEIQLQGWYWTYEEGKEIVRLWPCTYEEVMSFDPEGESWRGTKRGEWYAKAQSQTQIATQN